MKLPDAARQVVLAIGLLCYLSAITGITLQLHLLCYEHSDEHDHEDCDICKHFFASNHKFVPNSYTIFTCFEHLTLSTQYSSPTIPGLFFLRTFNPRPPPIFV
jgi:hypothetical protein